MKIQKNEAEWQLATISARLESPLIKKVESDLALDALMAHAVFNSTGLHGQAAHDQVPIARIEIEGQVIPLATGAMLAGNITLGLEKIGRNFRRDERTRGDFAGNTHKKKKCPFGVETKSGPYKGLQNQYLGIQANTISWHFFGDVNWVVNQLQSLMCVGARRNRGYGQLNDIQIDLVETADSTQVQALARRLFMNIDGHPTRNLPVRVWEALGGNLTTPAIDRISIDHPVWAETNLQLCVLADPFGYTPNAGDYDD